MPETKSKEFLAKFPLGKVPTFEDSEGFFLNESDAIAYYGISLFFKKVFSNLKSCAPARAEFHSANIKRYTSELLFQVQ